MVTTKRPVLATDYDLQALEALFRKNKRSTMLYGDLRHRLLKDFPRMTNDRQNDLIDYLVEHGTIERVGHGKWRLQETPEAPATKPVVQEPSNEQPEPAVTPPSGRPPRGEGTILRGLVKDYIGEHPGASAQQAAKFFEKEATTMSWYMGDLFRKGEVKRASEINPGGRGVFFKYYPLTSPMGQVASAVDERQFSAPQQRIIDYVTAHPGAVSLEIAEAHGVSRQAIGNYIGGLVADGVLSARRNGREIHYYPAAAAPHPAPPPEAPAAPPPPAPSAREIPLGDRIVAFVREHPASTAMSVARHFQMPEDKARDYLNVTYLNGRLRRLRKEWGPGKWYFEYYVPEHPAVKGRAPATSRPFTPSPQQVADATPPQVAGVPVTTVPARSSGPAPAPAMKLAMEKANVTVPARKGIIIQPLLYTIRVKLELDNPAQVEALQRLEEVCECETVSVENVPR